MSEVCDNPFKSTKCTNTDIKVYIQIRKTKRGVVEAVDHPICKECWIKIAQSNKEWGDEPRLNLDNKAVESKEE